MNFREQALEHEITHLQTRNKAYVYAKNYRVLCIAYSELATAHLRLFASEFICTTRYPHFKILPETRSDEILNGVRIVLSSTMEGFMGEVRKLIQEYKNLDRQPTIYILGVYLNPSDLFHLDVYVEY